MAKRSLIMAGMVKKTMEMNQEFTSGKVRIEKYLPFV